jgi:hypothetical protein
MAISQKIVEVYFIEIVSSGRRPLHKGTLFYKLKIIDKVCRSKFTNHRALKLSPIADGLIERLCVSIMGCEHQADMIKTR